MAASLARKLEGVFSVEVVWVAQASRLRAGLLVYHFSTSYQATISGVAYRDHGKVAVGRSEGRASADRGLVVYTRPWGGRG